MAMDPRGPTLLGGVELLERAIGYTHGSLLLVTPDALGNPTPCRRWNLRDLLEHMADSLVTLSDAAEVGRVDLDPADVTGEFLVDVVRVLRLRACRLLGAWAQPDGPLAVTVGDRSLGSEVLTRAGALEIAVHGWDVARACGEDRPIPAELAEQLLDLLPVLVTDADRVERFAAPIAVPPSAGPGDQLVARLGRRPA